MMRQITIPPDSWPPYGDIDLHPDNFNCGERLKGKEVVRHEGDNPPGWGYWGGPVACAGSTPDFFSDDPNCCHYAALEYAPAVGHVNRKPLSHIYTPQNNSAYVYGAAINFTVHTMDTDGRVYRVDWLYRVNGGSWQSAGTTYSYPFSISTSSLAPGNYEVRADAYDTAQAYTVSESKFFTVAPPPTAGEVLASNAILYPGQYRMSANGQYMFIYQTDGNLVLYGPPPSWPAMVATMTFGSGGTWMRTTGNLEVWNSASPPILGWQSNTGQAGNASSYVWVKNTGHVAIIRPNGSQVVQWP